MKNNIETLRPDLLNQLIRIYNNDGSVSNKTAKEVSLGSSLRAEWKCDKQLGHSSYNTPIKKKVKGQGCPTCANRRIESGINDLATTHPHLASQLIYIYNKDGSVSNKTAKDVSAGSMYYAEWKCDKELEHPSYRAIMYSRLSNKGCPTCVGNRCVSGINDLATTHPELAKQLIRIYNKDGSVSNKTAKDVSAGCNSSAEWSCASGHLNYIKLINKRNGGQGCPTCSNKRIEPGINDLATTHPELVKQLICIYNKDGSISNKTAKDVSSGSNLKAEWKCDKELDHPNYIKMFNKRNGGQGCPLCSVTTKTEGLFRDSFSQKAKKEFLSVNIPLKRKIFVSGMIQIDMLCEELNLVIEYDGAWSHGGVKNANKKRTIEDCLARDTDSTLALIKSGRKVIRIREWESREKLPFLELPEEYASNLYQITYKSFGKDKDNIDDLVKQIIEGKKDWFFPSVSNNANSATQNTAVLV